MTFRIPFVPDLPKPRSIPVRVMNLAALGGILIVTLFFDSELLIAAAAMVWSLASLLNLPPAVTIAFAALVAIPTLWACVAVAILVYDRETDPGRELS
ncbi:MAG TPA: hypothetical protein VK862_16970 [Afifellaceae bacterium]|nr:hypothetical protein [Afifellaceae bacterium]